MGMEPEPEDTSLAPPGSVLPADTGASQAEGLERVLSAAPLPVWRKAYLANLIESGRRFAEAGNGRGSQYCFAKVQEALRALPAAPLAEALPAPESARPDRPAERVRRQWRQDRIGHAEKVLESHGARLSRLEKRAYLERLAKLREATGQPSQAGKADASLLELRRRLYQRVLKSQKVALFRKRMPKTQRAALPARISATPSAWHPVTGPYNDRSNLEELLSVIGAADPVWAEEFLDLYGGLIGLNALLAAVPRK